MGVLIILGRNRAANAARLAESMNGFVEVVFSEIAGEMQPKKVRVVIPRLRARSATSANHAEADIPDEHHADQQHIERDPNIVVLNPIRRPNRRTIG
jgi:hypothetical protein